MIKKTLLSLIILFCDQSHALSIRQVEQFLAPASVIEELATHESTGLFAHHSVYEQVIAYLSKEEVIQLEQTVNDYAMTNVGGVASDLPNPEPDGLKSLLGNRPLLATTSPANTSPEVGAQATGETGKVKYIGEKSAPSGGDSQAKPPPSEIQTKPAKVKKKTTEPHTQSILPALEFKTLLKFPKQLILLGAIIGLVALTVTLGILYFRNRFKILDCPRCKTTDEEALETGQRYKSTTSRGYRIKCYCKACGYKWIQRM